MNILLVSAMFPPIRTGTSFYSKNLAETLTHMGHKVTVVTLRNDDTDDDRYGFETIRLKAIHFSFKNYFKHFRISSVFLSNYFAVSGIVKKNNIGIVLLVNHYLDIAFPAIFAAKSNKIPLIISVGTQLQSLHPFRNKLLIFLDRLIPGRLVFPFCTRIVAWDKEIERYLWNVQRLKIAQKTIIIPFGINGNQNEFISYRHNYDRTDQIIGVGAIISQRNYHYHLHVFKELLKKYPDLTLKIIGHIYKPASIELARKLGISSHVIFTGYQ